MVLEVRFADGVWYRGRLVKRVAGSTPPRWRVQFDDGETRDDIRLGIMEVRFDASAYGATVEVSFTNGEWYRGRLVELVRGSEQWGVAFEDGEWKEDVRLGDPNVRYMISGGGLGRGGRRGREGGSQAEHHLPTVSQYPQVRAFLSSRILSSRPCSIGQETPLSKVDVCSATLKPCIPFQRSFRKSLHAKMIPPVS